MTRRGLLLVGPFEERFYVFLIQQRKRTNTPKYKSMSLDLMRFLQDKTCNAYPRPLFFG